MTPATLLMICAAAIAAVVAIATLIRRARHAAKILRMTDRVQWRADQARRDRQGRE